MNSTQVYHNTSSILQHGSITIPAVHYNIGISQSQQYITTLVYHNPSSILQNGSIQSQQYISRWVCHNPSSILQHGSITIPAVYYNMGLSQSQLISQDGSITITAVYFSIHIGPSQSKQYTYHKSQFQCKQFISTLSNNPSSSLIKYNPSSIYLLVPVTIPATDFNMSTSLIQAVSIYLCQ